jgi:Zn-dependent protease with chaperone function
MKAYFPVPRGQFGRAGLLSQAVLGHEITHGANGDMVTLALLQGVLNTFVIFLARIIDGFIDRVSSVGSHPPLDERIAALQSSAG